MPDEVDPIFASALSAAGSADRAAGEACERVAAQLHRTGRPTTRPELVLAFASGAHAAMLGAIAARLRREFDPQRLLAAPAPSVLGGREAYESRPGLSLLVGHMPGVRTYALNPDQLAHAPEDVLERAMGEGGDRRATFLFADPSSAPLGAMLPRLARLHARSTWGEPPPIVGAVTSAGERSRGSFILDDEVHASGAVGLTIAGDVRVDVVASQGCRPFGEPMLITRAHNNIIQELGGRSAVEAIRDAASALSHEQRALLPGGLFLGLVVDEYKDRFGRGDFLIRRIRAVDESSGAVAVEELVSVGRTVQLHLRDARTADDDLALLLDAQSIHGRPLGGLLFSSGGRGRDFFGDASHDPALVQRAFRPELPAERQAKGGEEIDPETPLVPLAGLMTTAEIAPAGGMPRVHTHSAVLTLFRKPAPAD
ncbi:MAG: FIST N-terminal domain-containing protein [Phycisphaerales bacterium]